jgi:hypothetical protein
MASAPQMHLWLYGHVTLPAISYLLHPRVLGKSALLSGTSVLVGKVNFGLYQGWQIT